MKKFTINELEKFSGIKANTLRAWEKRYNLLRPARTVGNIRQYNFEELAKLLNVSLLTKNGFAISRLAEAGPSAWEEKLNALDGVDNLCRMALHELLLKMHDVPCRGFEEVLNKLVKIIPVEIVAQKTLHPFLTATGLMWQGHRYTEEHLVVTAIRKKLFLAIEMLPDPHPETESIILFLPDNKLLDLGLLYANYRLKSAGKQVIYLGNDVTYQNLINMVEAWKPSYIFSYLDPGHSFPLERLLNHLEGNAPACNVIHANIPGKKSKRDSLKNYISLGFDEAVSYVSHRA